MVVELSCKGRMHNDPQPRAGLALILGLRVQDFTVTWVYCPFVTSPNQIWTRGLKNIETTGEGQVGCGIWGSAYWAMGGVVDCVGLPVPWVCGVCALCSSAG